MSANKMPNEDELEAIRKLEPLRKLIEDEKPEDFDPLPLGDKERAERLEAMVDRLTEVIVELKFEIAESNSLLRSASSIAERDGDSTNWNAFRRKLDIELSRQFALMQKYDIRPI